MLVLLYLNIYLCTIQYNTKWGTWVDMTVEKKKKTGFYFFYKILLFPDASHSCSSVKRKLIKICDVINQNEFELPNNVF